MAMSMSGPQIMLFTAMARFSLDAADNFLGDFYGACISFLARVGQIWKLVPCDVLQLGTVLHELVSDSLVI